MVFALPVALACLASPNGQVRQTAIVEAAFRNAIARCRELRPTRSRFAISVSDMTGRSGEPGDQVVADLRKIGTRVVSWDAGHSDDVTWIDVGHARHLSNTVASTEVWIHGIAVSKTVGRMERATLKLIQMPDGWRVSGTAHGWKTWTHPRK